MMAESDLRILIVEDQTIVREGLCAMLATKPGLQVVGVAADGDEACLLYTYRSPRDS